jgi:membrane protein implicated in regulation of membrane protease activity
VTPTTAAVAFLIGGVVLCAVELVAPGLVVLPFGIGALVASVAGFLGAAPAVQAVVFLVVSAAAFAALRPLARRLNRAGEDDGVGARRLVGAHAVVLEHIRPGETGLVRVDREEWRAESAEGSALSPGAAVRVVEVRGTRVLVEPAAAPSGPLPADRPTGPPTEPPSGGKGRHP